MAEQELQRLDGQIEQLLASHVQLLQQMRKLQADHARLSAECTRLADKNQAASQKLKDIITRLQGMEYSDGQ